MHICHVIEAAGGGSGQVVIDLAKHCVKAGDKITIIYAPARAKHHFVASLKDLKGVKSIALPMQRKIGLHDFIDIFHLLRCLYREGPFDIIHGHSSKAGALIRIVGIVLRRPVKIYTPHAFITMAPGASRIYSWIEWLLSWFCDAIITVSPQEEKHALDKLGISKSKIHMILNGIDFDYKTDRASVRAKMGISEREYVVGFVGRMVPQKNPKRLVATFSLIANALPNARLVIVGSGPLLEETEFVLDRRGLLEKTQIFKKHNARDLMPGFDCLLCTSDYESYGLIFPEALAAGVPIVAPPVGIAEMATAGGKTGYIAGFDPEDLAKAVLKLASLDSNERREMSIKAKELSLQFGAEAMARRTRDLYNQLLENKRRQAT